MDKPLPDDFDPYGARVNYGIHNGNGNGKLIWWILGGMMALNVGVAVAGIGFVGSALYNMNARLAVVETRLSECSK
jgi:hypothetical protein